MVPVQSSGQPSYEELARLVADQAAAIAERDAVIAPPRRLPAAALARVHRRHFGTLARGDTATIPTTPQTISRAIDVVIAGLSAQYCEARLQRHGHDFVPCLSDLLVQHHANKEGKRVAGQQFVRLVDLAQVKSHATTVAGLGRPSLHW